MELPTTATATATAPTYNVRELLELERRLYDDSIDKQMKLHDALLRGDLHEYVLQCRPFEKDRHQDLQVAMMRHHFNKQNALDLLDFELQQAQDDYQDHKKAVKRKLMEAALQRRKRLLERLQEIDKDKGKDGALLTPATAESAEPSPDGAAGLILPAAHLEEQLVASRAATQAAFNLAHLTHNLPPVEHIVQATVAEMDRYEAFQRQEKDPETVCAVVVDEPVGKVWIGLMDVFAISDNIVLWSSLSGEEFFGTLVGVTKTQIELKLLGCGEAKVFVQVDQLRKQLCTLRHQETSATQTQDDGGGGASPRTPKRKRQRRKHTIGLRKKI